ncbi:MAG: hypothetical protein ACI9WU_003664 [Myxococcota bacterium]|jgi:hypothetical protein
MTRHLWDALCLNIRRAPGYAARSRGRSLPLSLMLVVTEAIVLPTALVFDWLGRRFQRQGVPVVCGDFIAMSEVAEATVQPTGGRADARAFAQLTGLLAGWEAAVRRRMLIRDFAEVAELTSGILARLDALETESGGVFAMTRHVLESVGYAAKNALDYVEATTGRSAHLSKVLVAYQVFGVALAPKFDRLAQVCHERGAGIIVNDVPAIPF